MTGAEVMIAAAAASAIMGVGSAVMSAQSAVSAGEEEVKQIGRQQEQLIERSNLQEHQQRKRDAAFRSKQLAQIGKAGIQLTESPAALVERTAAEQEMDLLIQKYNTQLGVENLQSEKAVASQRAEDTAKSSLLKIPTILSKSAGQAAGAGAFG